MWQWGNHSVTYAVRSFHQSDHLTSYFWSKFYDQNSSDDILSEGHLMLLSVSCNMCKDFFKETFFKMNKFPKKEPINFCKFYDNEGATQLILRSDHFINPTVWYLFVGPNFITSILMMMSFHKGVVVSVPCDIDKH